MANFVYTKIKETLLSGGINFTSATLKVLLVNIGSGHYIADSATDQYLSDVSSGDRLAISDTLTTISVTDGIFGADTATFTSPTPSADSGDALIIYKDTGSAATSPLICYLDTYPGLPITPDGSDIKVFWPGTANKIFQL